MNKITEARKAKGWTQAELAGRLGVTQQAVQRYESGTRDLKASTLRNLSEALGVTVAYLLGMTDTEPPRTEFVDVPLLGPIAAGRPLDMETADDTHPIPAVVHDTWPNAFLLRVEGESMNRILPNGCYALVDPCAEVDCDGQPYAVIVDGHAATIKRVRRLANGLELAPDSTDPTFRPQVLDYAATDGPSVAVVGRIVWHCVPYGWSY